MKAFGKSLGTIIRCAIQWVFSLWEYETVWPFEYELGEYTSKSSERNDAMPKPSSSESRGRDMAMGNNSQGKYMDATHTRFDKRKKRKKKKKEKRR